MKSSSFLIVTGIIFFYLADLTGQKVCRDQYNANELILSAITKLDAVSNCTGSNYYNCRAAFQNLYDAEDRLTRSVNQSIDNQCVTCDLTNLNSIASDINLGFGILESMRYGSYHTNLEFTTRQWMDPRYRCREIPSRPPKASGISDRWYAGDWYDPIRGILSLRQSGNKISGSARGVKSGDHWGSGHREGLRVVGEVLVDGSLRLDMHNGDGTYTECRLDLPDREHLTGQWTWYTDASKRSEKDAGSITLVRRT